MTETTGEIVLGIGLIVLSAAGVVSLAILRSMLTGKNGSGTGVPPSECAAWRHGIGEQVESLKRGQEALFQRTDRLSEKDRQ